MGFNEELKELEKKFSGKQRKLVQKIELLVNQQVAEGLVALQHVERVSKTEIEVIANIISQFSPLEISSFNCSPRSMVISGKTSKGHLVSIEPQYKVDNSNPKAQPWAIDLVIELYKPVGVDLVYIGALGVEYDGFATHYLETKVKSTYRRDIKIAEQTGIQSIRISPGHWDNGNGAEDIKKAIKKYFEHLIKIADSLQQSTINAVQLNRSVQSRHDGLERDTTCPVCNGRGRLAGDECPVCHDTCTIKEHIAAKLDISEYENIKCPVCNNISLDCSTCDDKGYISRERALEW
ncbi:hypothetical protein [Vibrio splendidus]|uniref:hypothetical protein n=1 Tax=Vibrio splendidus TaxID=29497 RepID=UPI000C830054|nr:hypothetical protein [Vibrio splendidus]PMK16033.1 hypothetical protein BCU08_00695 [Vibrio splendidus]